MIRFFVFSMAVVGIAVALLAVTSTPGFANDDPGVIHACSKKNNGQLRVVSDPSKCLPSENRIDLQKAGVQVAIADSVKPRIAFVTSGTFNGNLGGLDGADEKCQAAADAAGLPGEYKAWLSDDSSSPVMRFNVPLGPIHTTTGDTIAGSWGDLTDGELNVPIDKDENGVVFSGINIVWTGTTVTGSPEGNANCSNWTSDSAGDEGNSGAADFADGNWTQIAAANTSCDSALHLYCFEQ